MSVLQKCALNVTLQCFSEPHILCHASPSCRGPRQFGLKLLESYAASSYNNPPASAGWVTFSGDVVYFTVWDEESILLSGRMTAHADTEC